MTAMMPGKNKGPISEASDKDLDYWINRLSRDLEENPDKKYADDDRAKLEAMLAVRASRAAGGAPAPAAAAPQTQQHQQAPRAAPQPTGQAIVQQRGEMALAGSWSNADQVSARLQDAAAEAHLVSPATMCGALPEGCSVAMSIVHVDTNSTEVYAITGWRDNPKPDDTMGLGKVALDKIAGAAGISWVSELTGRLDDGRDPRYVHFRAVARVRDFDGTVRELPGEVEIDARDGSPQIEEIITKAKKANKGQGRDPSSQILELRKFIIRHAESKAMNRAIRKLGVRTSYKRAELSKPFAVAKIMFDGHSDNPEIRRMFAERIADNFLGARASLYGPPQRQPAPQMAAPAAVPQLQGHAPPPVGAVPADDGAIDTDYESRPDNALPDNAAPSAAAPTSAAPEQPTDGGY